MDRGFFAQCTEGEMDANEILVGFKMLNNMNYHQNCVPTFAIGAYVSTWLLPIVSHSKYLTIYFLPGVFISA